MYGVCVCVCSCCCFRMVNGRYVSTIYFFNKNIKTLISFYKLAKELQSDNVTVTLPDLPQAQVTRKLLCALASYVMGSRLHLVCAGARPFLQKSFVEVDLDRMFVATITAARSTFNQLQAGHVLRQTQAPRRAAEGQKAHGTVWADCDLGDHGEEDNDAHWRQEQREIDGPLGEAQSVRLQLCRKLHILASDWRHVAW